MNNSLRSLIVTIFQFCTILVGILVVIGVLEKNIVTDSVYSKKGLSLSSKISRVFVGDSHIMCAINDSIIPNSFNASRNSESIFQTYNKLNRILENNPQVKEVYLGFAPHNVSEQANGLILYGDRYYPLLDNSSRMIIKNGNKNGLLPIENKLSDKYKSLKHDLIFQYLNFKYTNGIIYNLNESIDYCIGNIYDHPVFTKPYNSCFVNISDEATTNIINRHYHNNCNNSSIMISYIFKIDSICDGKGVKLYLLNTPLHKNYASRIPECHNKNYYQLVCVLVKNLKVTHLDLKDHVKIDSLFGDGDHLNYHGRNIFSRDLSQSILASAF